MKDSDKITAVTGLRGIGCLMVVLHHCYYHAGKYSLLISTFDIAKFSAYGHLGVNLFFAVSGFCLSSSHFKNKTREFNWKDYAWRRAVRILPPYWAAFLGILLLCFLEKSFQIDCLQKSGFNYLPTRNQFLTGFFLIGTFYNASFWTLCVEMRWYIINPFVVYTQKKIGQAWLQIFSWGISYAYLYFEPIPGSSEILKKTYYLIGPIAFFMPVFSSGVYAAWLTRNKEDGLICKFFEKYGVMLLLCSFIGLFIFTPAIPEALSWKMLIPSTSISFLLVFLGVKNKRFIGILSLPIVVKLGTISYSIYLIHEPLVRGCYIYTSGYKWSPLTQYLFYQGVFPLFLIFLGFLFFQLVEKRSLKILGI